MHRPIFARVAFATMLAAPACAVDTVPEPLSPKLAFVSSVTGTGNIASWPQAHSLTGLAAADEVCATLAADAGLGGGGSTWVAWLSDRSNDAYCRVHGLTGTKAGNCGGLPSLPTNAGPWVRTDGTPFADVIYLAMGLNGRIYTALELDEWGQSVASDPLFFTATTSEGEFDDTYGDCSLWTSSGSETTRFGSTDHTTRSWGSWALSTCTPERHLACFEVGAGGTLPVVSVPGRVAFVTSVIGRGSLDDLSEWPENGNLSGVAAADNVCRMRAAAAGLDDPGSFVAWISDSGAGIDAIDRLTNDGRWIRIDGLPVAESKADLVDGRVFTSLNVTEFGAYVPNEVVWTGTGSDGRAGSADCDGWSDQTETATTGTANALSSLWTVNYSPSSCSNQHGHLYCFSNVSLLIFSDGFENGSTDQWSTTVPPRAATTDGPPRPRGGPEPARNRGVALIQTEETRASGSRSSDRARGAGGRATSRATGSTTTASPPSDECRHSASVTHSERFRKIAPLSE